MREFGICYLELGSLGDRCLIYFLVNGLLFFLVEVEFVVGMFICYLRGFV